MYYTNELEIEMKDNATAMKALELMKTRLEMGFEADKGYKRNPSQRLMNDLYVENNIISLPEEEGYYITEEADDVFIELLNVIAAELPDEHFTCANYNLNDYSESHLEAAYENGILKTKSIYYPIGYTEALWCEECGGEVVRFEDYDPTKTYICPECGEELDLTEAYEESRPQITEKEIKIEK